MAAQPQQVSLTPLDMRFGDTTRKAVPYAKDPTVIRHGDRYLMYYSIPPYDKAKVPERPDPEQKGWHSGVAESKDLVHWRRVGDLNLRDTRGTRIWGAVAPCVKKLDGKIHLFYQRPWKPAHGNNNLWHATSEDGLTFANTHDEPIFIPNNGWSNDRSIDAEVYRVGDSLVLMFATRDAEGKIQQLGMAKAAYGCDYGPGQWAELTGQGPLLKPEHPWEGRCIEAPTVIRRGGFWYLFYAGAYNHERQMIGLAVSEDGFAFRRVGADGLIFPAGAKGAWNEGESGHPGVFEDDDGQVYLFFQGKKSIKANYYLSVCKVEFK